MIWMILQGLYNILELYSDQKDSFYANIDKYFIHLLNHDFDNFSGTFEDLVKITETIINKFKIELINLGFNKAEIENKFMSSYLNFTQEDREEIHTIDKLYKKMR